MRTPLSTSSILLPAAPETRGRTGQVQNGNNSTAHLSTYDYMRATGITGIESSLVPFEHLLAIMRFDLTLEGYDPKADGEPCLFLLHYEGEKPFYETLSASTAAGIGRET